MRVIQTLVSCFHALLPPCLHYALCLALFQTQTFSLYLWRALLGKWQPPYNSLHNVRLEVICKAHSSLHLPLSLFPLHLLARLLFNLKAFLHCFFILTPHPPFSPSVGGHSIFNHHGRLSVQGGRGEGGRRERARERGRENWRSVLLGARGGGKESLKCSRLQTPNS